MPSMGLRRMRLFPSPSSSLSKTGDFITMKNKSFISATLLFAASLPLQLSASTFDFSFSGSGVSGTVDVTYGTATDATYPQAFEITGVSGTFSDSNISPAIVDVPITGLQPLSLAAHDPLNFLTPADFSKFAVASGLPPMSNGSVTYDNLYYPNGSPQTASDYPFQGGFLDIYGLAFDIGGGTVVDIFSNGTMSGIGPFDYGVVVATSATALDYVAGGVSVSAAATPEPSAFILLGSGLAGMLAWRRRSAVKDRA
jgi:PEP-CTERM motif